MRRLGRREPDLPQLLGTHGTASLELSDAWTEVTGLIQSACGKSPAERSGQLHRCLFSKLQSDYQDTQTIPMSGLKKYYHPMSL